MFVIKSDVKHVDRCKVKSHVSTYVNSSKLLIYIRRHMDMIKFKVCFRLFCKKKKKN